VLHADGTKQPLFFLHGDYLTGADYDYGGELWFWYRDVAHELGADQPFYAIDPGRVDAAVAPTFDAFVAAHLQTVRAVQPEGPYVLGGSCNGALMALEMARQLQAEGMTVSLLILVEPFAATAYHRLGRRFMSGIGGLAGLGLDKQLDWFLRLLPLLEFPHGCQRYLSRCVRYVRRRLGLRRHASLRSFVRVASAELMRGIRRVERLAHRHTRQPALTDERVRLGPGRPRGDYPGIFRWMAADYFLRPYAGPVAFFWSSERFEEEPSAPARWLEVAEGAEVHVIPGMLTPGGTEHARDVAAQWTACLTRAAANPLANSPLANSPLAAL
jgi:Thioesterase domain